MNRLLHFLPLILSAALFSCNPDCDSVVGLRVTYGPMLIGDAHPSGLPGQQILLTAEPPSSLAGRRIFFKDMEVKNVEFIPGKGLSVRIPESMPEGQVELRVEDPDCVDFVSLNFDVVNSEFFENNPNYVFPPFPEIVVPTLQPSFPPTIENAWLSVNELDYCIWFKFAKDANGNCTTELDPMTSREQCFGDCLTSRDSLYDDNPVSGVIDPANNFIHIIVNRTRWNGGYEEFVGEFIDPAETGQYQEWEAGNEPINIPGIPVNTSRDHMILLTSLSTGRTMLIYQQDLNVAASTHDCL